MVTALSLLLSTDTAECQSTGHQEVEVVGPNWSLGEKNQHKLFYQTDLEPKKGKSKKTAPKTEQAQISFYLAQSESKHYRSYATSVSHLLAAATLLSLPQSEGCLENKFWWLKSL